MMRQLEIKGYVCPRCKWSDVHQVTVCPRCHSPLEMASYPGRGKIASFTVIHYPPKGFENQTPYVIAIVDLEDGPRVIARINGSVEKVSIGSSVNLTESKGDFLTFSISE